VLFPYDPARAVKGFDLAEAAMAIVARSVPAKISIVSGEPPEKMPYHYNAADLLLLTSHSEGSPNAVKEAMACNLPVVATPVGDIRERISGARWCHIVERSPRHVAEAILSVLASPDPRSDGRERIAPLEGSAVARRIVAIYGSVLG
jgi:glycosyltransferase involved in cell wall biosynthesis